MTGPLDRQEVITVLDVYEVGNRIPPNVPSYRESVADGLMALAERYVAPTLEVLDGAAAAALVLRDAAAEQRRLSVEARTDIGLAEHEDIADWLDERADLLAGEAEGGERDGRLGLVSQEGQQGLGTCSPEAADDEEFCPKCFAGTDAANHNECTDVRRQALGLRLGQVIADLDARDETLLDWAPCNDCPNQPGPCACSGAPMARDELIDAALALLNGAES